MTNISAISAFSNKEESFIPIASDWQLYSAISRNKLKSSVIQTKAMTARQFEEEEHPRAPKGSSEGGQFVADPNNTASSTPTPEKSAHGGTRAGAGRTPKDPVLAKQKLRERFRQEMPDASQGEIDKRIENWALEKNNTDLYLLMTNEPEYMKQRDKERMDALLSKGTKQKVGGKDIERVDDSEGTTAVRSDLKTSAAAWNRMVQQSKDLSEAYETFKDSGQAEEVDKNKAKLITAAAAIAAVVGLGVLIAKRPKATIAVERAVGKDNLTWIRWFKAQGLDKDIGEAAEHIKLREGIIDERKIGAIRNMMGRIAEKFGKIDPKTGERLYPFLGPKATGFGPKSRYAPRDFKIIKNAKNYVPTHGDIDAETGLWLVRGQGKAIQVNHKAIAFAHGRVPMDPAKWGEGKWAKVLRDKDGNPKPPPGLRIKTRTDGVQEWDYEKGEVGEKQFKNWLSQNQKRYPSPEAIIDPESGIPYDSKWPSRIGRLRDPEKYNVDIKAAEEYRGYLHYFDFNVLPKVSGRVLAMLTAAAGTTGGGAYYFQSDIENWLSSYTKHRQEGDKAAAKIQAPHKKSDSKERLKEIKAQTAYVKEQQKLADRQRGAADSKIHLEQYRNEIRNILAKEGVRKYLEGTVLTWASVPETFQRRLEDTGVWNNETRAQQIIDVLKSGNIDEINNLSAEINNLRVLRHKNEWNFVDENGRWPNQVEQAFFKTHKKWPKQKPSSTAGAYAADDKDEAQANARQTKTQGISGLGLIMKMFDAEPKEPKVATEDDIITAMAAEIAKMIVDISQSCKTAIQSGMPGNTDFADLNDIVVSIVRHLKDSTKKNNPEKVETKALDMAGVMSSQMDAQGGLFAEPRVCSICGKQISEELLLKCNDAKCPTRFWTKVVEKTKEATI